MEFDQSFINIYIINNNKRHVKVKYCKYVDLADKYLKQINELIDKNENIGDLAFFVYFEFIEFVNKVNGEFELGFLDYITESITKKHINYLVNYVKKRIHDNDREFFNMFLSVKYLNPDISSWIICCLPHHDYSIYTFSRMILEILDNENYELTEDEILIYIDQLIFVKQKKYNDMSRLIACDFYVYKFIVKQILRQNDYKISKYVIKNLPYYLKDGFGVYLYNEILKRDKVVNINHLELACGLKDCHLMLKVLEEKIIPTNECFEMVCVDYKNKYDVEEKLELLCKYGLEITQEMIKELLRKGIIIRNFDDLDISLFDDEIRNYFIMLGHVPKKLEETLSHQEKLLMLFSSKNNMNAIVQLIKEKKISPDIKCLEGACKIRNKQYIEFICSKFNIEPNKKCINYLLSHSNACLLLRILVSYMK